MADLKGIDSQDEEEPTIAEDVVVTKYKMAGDMANSKSTCVSYLPWFFYLTSALCSCLRRLVSSS